MSSAGTSEGSGLGKDGEFSESGPSITRGDGHSAHAICPAITV